MCPARYVPCFASHTSIRQLNHSDGTWDTLKRTTKERWEEVVNYCKLDIYRTIRDELSSDMKNVTRRHILRNGVPKLVRPAPVGKLNDSTAAGLYSHKKVTPHNVQCNWAAYGDNYLVLHF